MVDPAFTVDLSKPLVFQVGHLGEAYYEWVHQPIVGKETPRFFENEVLEFLTRTPWWAIPLVWLPVVCWFVRSSIKDGLPQYHVAPSMVAGMIIWTLLEYSLHRFLFHMETKSYWGNTFHYLIHGCHHKHPMDGLRLVFPPAAAVILAIGLWNLVKLVSPEPYSPALFGGGLFGYVMYDCTHYYLHYGKPLKGVSHNLKPAAISWSGEMVAQGFTVDLNKPLVFQVGHLLENYEEWIHQPIGTKESPRYFENDTLEFLTRTRWWVIPLVWLPLVGWFLSRSIASGCSIPQVFFMTVFGIFVWTLIEYTLHRFLFHIKTKSYWGNTFHYLLHGCHHKHPMDGLRLVFPPAATAILLFPFWHLTKLLSPPSITTGIFAGGLLGYVLYDLTHYYLHHGQPASNITKSLKRYHLNHHFRIHNKGFGITSALWDKVFGTLPPAKLA